MSGKGNKKKNTRSRSKRKRNEADKLGDSLSKNEKTRRTRKRRQTKIYGSTNYVYAAKAKITPTCRERAGTSYKRDDVFSQSFSDDDDDDVYADDKVDDDDHIFTPNKSVAKKSINVSSSSRKKRHDKKKKMMTEDQINAEITKLKNEHLDICIRRCIDNPRHPSRKPQWGEVKAAYEDDFNTDVSTSD